MSRQISSLESNINIKLFNRNKHVVSLTPAGEVFADGLRKLAKNYEYLLEEVREIQTGNSGVIRLAALSGVMLHRNMLQILNNFEVSYPNIRVELRTYSLDDLRDMLAEHLIDFVYGATEDFVDKSNFAYEVVCNVRKHIVVPIAHPLADLADARAGNLSLADFRDDTFVFTKHQTLAIKSFLSKCKEAGFSPKYITVDDDSMLLLSVQMRRAILLLDEAHVFRNHESLTTLPVASLGSTELGIIHDITNTKTCKCRFLEFIHSAAPLN